jgi:hypothetical protein
VLKLLDNFTDSTYVSERFLQAYHGSWPAGNYSTQRAGAAATTNRSTPPHRCWEPKDVGSHIKDSVNSARICHCPLARQIQSHLNATDAIIQAGDCGKKSHPKLQSIHAHIHNHKSLLAAAPKLQPGQGRTTYSARSTTGSNLIECAHMAEHKHTAFPGSTCTPIQC